MGDGELEVVERAEQRDQNDGGDEQVEEDGERVDLDGGVEGGERAGRIDDVQLVKSCETGSCRAKDGEPAQGLAGLTRTAVTVRMSSGRRARRLVDISGPP
jgi:hypothetical protein